MSEEQLKAFLEAVKTDSVLQEKLKAATSPDSVVATAEEAGFAITVEEFTKTQAEVSEKELENVAGGMQSMYNNCKAYVTDLTAPC